MTRQQCSCINGIVYPTEQELVDELRAKQGTGETTSFSFGFSPHGRTWRPCINPKCDKRKTQ